MSLIPLPQLTVHGSSAAMGAAYGAAYGELIRGFVTMRLRAAKAYLWERGSRDLDGFLALGAACHAVFAEWDAEAAAEHAALAEAAGVGIEELYTCTNMTDIRDVLLCKEGQKGDGETGPTADAEGCSALLLPAERCMGGNPIAAQTWDLNPQDLDYVVAIQRRPDAGPATWTVTCAGCPTLVGMNEHGVCVGTTNVKTNDAHIGVGYLSVLHNAVRQPTAAAAAEAVRTAPRAAAHTYFVADAHTGSFLSCAADIVHEHPLETQALVQTNHCQEDELFAMGLEAPNSSSLARLKKLQALTDGANFTADTVQAWFADRSDGVDSINRYAEDKQGTATNACCIMDPVAKSMRACKGTADRGEWVQLGFGN